MGSSCRADQVWSVHLPSPSPYFCSPKLSDGIHEIKPASFSRPVTSSYIYISFECSELFLDMPAEDCPEHFTLGTLHQRHLRRPSTAPRTFGPCLVEITITLKDASFTTKFCSPQRNGDYRAVRFFSAFGHLSPPNPSPDAKYGLA